MKPLVRQSNFCIVLSREGKYYFIEYSSCRFRTTQAFPGRTGEEVSLEESEEEAEGGEELLGKSPVDAFGPLPHAGSLPALPPGGAEGQPAATTKGQEDRGCLGSARGDASGAVRLEVLEENSALRGCGIPCQSSLPTSPSPACLRKKEPGCAQRWLRRCPHFSVPPHDLASPPRVRTGTRGDMVGESHVTHGSGGEVRWGFLLSTPPWWSSCVPRGVGQAQEEGTTSKTCSPHLQGEG